MIDIVLMLTRDAAAGEHYDDNDWDADEDEDGCDIYRDCFTKLLQPLSITQKSHGADESDR